MDYQEYEEKGRAKFERNCSLPHKFTKGEYDSYDVSTTGHANTFNIEIKDREIKFEKYADDGFWLEKTKFDALMKAFRKTGSLPIYLNYFQEGIGIFWDLSKIEPERIKWKKILATEKTANGTYGKTKVKKTVVFLFPKEGRKFRYE